MNPNLIGKARGRTRKIPIAEPTIGEAEISLVNDAVRSGWVSSIGRYVTEFEALVAAYVGVEEGVSVCNGTAALQLSMAGIGIGPGDEVIVPSLTFVATANAVRILGATPVFADVCADHWCLDPVSVSACLSTRTRAIVPVHLYGNPAPMDELRSLASERSLALIEDAAEALGADAGGVRAGALGDLGTFSFYGNKLITTGEGGMITLSDSVLATRLRLLRDHAMDSTRRYWHESVGYNFRLTNLQAALGVAQFGRIDQLLKRKREIAQRYREAFLNHEQIAMQAEAPGCASSWWLTTILLPSCATRDRLADELGEVGVDTRPIFVPNHLLPPYRSGLRLPVTEDLGERGLSLPSSPSLSELDQERVISAVMRSLETP